MIPPTHFDVSGGTVPGRDHLFQHGLLIGKNNQDAYAWRVLHGGTVVAAVVCDGCGSGSHSEVGAKICTELLLSAIERRLPEPRDDVTLSLTTEFWQEIHRELLEQIRTLARNMAGRGSMSATIAETFLCTVVGTLVTQHGCWVFSIGDGVAVVDGDPIIFGPFPNNAPPYLAYGITGSNIPEHAGMLTFSVSTFPTPQQGVLIGSDGVLELMKLEHSTMPGSTNPIGPISQFWTDARYVKNRDMIRRKLTLLNSLQIETLAGVSNFVPGRLQDDATLVIVRPNPSN